LVIARVRALRLGAERGRRDLMAAYGPVEPFHAGARGDCLCGNPEAH
jgi:hypothetical protein